MKLTSLLALLLAFSLHTSTQAQEFIDGSFTFSHKKDAYFILKDGSEITAFVSKINRKKGLITEIRIKMADDSKRTLSPDEIQQMYLPPTGLDKVNRALDRATDLTRLDTDNGVNDGYIQEGYVLFESAEFIIKKNKRVVLAQLVNPGFANPVKVYFDPFAKETASASVGGMKVAGGIAKSYYVRIGNDPAYKLTKKNYSAFAQKEYKTCRPLKLSAKESYKWADFARHLYTYSTECAGN